MLFFLQTKLWSICAVICHCQMKKGKKICLKMLAHFVSRICILNTEKLLLKWMTKNGLDNGNNLLNKRVKSNKSFYVYTGYSSRVSQECICRVHVSKKNQKQKKRRHFTFKWMGIGTIVLNLSSHVLQHGHNKKKPFLRLLTASRISLRSK